SCLLRRVRARSLKRQMVRTVLVRVVAMAGDPFPLDLVLLGDLIKLVPKVLVQDRLAIRLEPRVWLPPRKELRNSFLQILGVTYQVHAAWRFQCAQAFDSSHQLHTVTSRVLVAAA